MTVETGEPLDLIGQSSDLKSDELQLQWRPSCHFPMVLRSHEHTNPLHSYYYMLDKSRMATVVYRAELAIMTTAIENTLL